MARELRERRAADLKPEEAGDLRFISAENGAMLPWLNDNEEIELRKRVIATITRLTKGAP
jgi:hypothetical protein